MGIHGQYENEHFHIAVESVAAACRTHGVALGVAGIKSVDLLRRFADLGLQFISAGTDVGMMTEAATARAQALRGLRAAPADRLSAGLARRLQEDGCPPPRSTTIK